MGGSEDLCVHLHVGTPKSGTTYLQGELAHNRALLRANGYLYPGTKHAAHFMAALSLRGRGFRGHHYPESEGAWDDTVADVLGFEGPALISHEILGGAPDDQIRRAVGSFQGRPVAVVVTCRDLGRQLPAVWQEAVKNGTKQPYEKFLAQVFSTWETSARTTGSFWASQDLAALATRWGDVVGPERVTFVTVPPSGAGPDELWRRFSSAVDLPDADYQGSDQPANPSLGTVETELLRRLTTRLPEDLPWPTHARLIKRRLAQRELVRHRTGGMLTVPAEYRAQTQDIAFAMVESIRAGGYRVVGDLDELTPSFRDDGSVPADVSDSQLLDLALDVMVPLALRESKNRRRRPVPPPQQAPPPGRASRVRAAVARLRGRLRG